MARPSPPVADLSECRKSCTQGPLNPESREVVHFMAAQPSTNTDIRRVLAHSIHCLVYTLQNGKHVRVLPLIPQQQQRGNPPVFKCHESRVRMAKFVSAESYTVATLSDAEIFVWDTNATCAPLTTRFTLKLQALTLAWIDPPRMESQTAILMYMHVRDGSHAVCTVPVVMDSSTSPATHSNQPTPTPTTLKGNLPTAANHMAGCGSTMAFACDEYSVITCTWADAQHGLSHMTPWKPCEFESSVGRIKDMLLLSSERLVTVSDTLITVCAAKGDHQFSQIIRFPGVNCLSLFSATHYLVACLMSHSQAARHCEAAVIELNPETGAGTSLRFFSLPAPITHQNGCITPHPKGHEPLLMVDTSSALMCVSLSDDSDHTVLRLNPPDSRAPWSHLDPKVAPFVPTSSTQNTVSAPEAPQRPSAPTPPDVREPLATDPTPHVSAPPVLLPASTRAVTSKGKTSDKATGIHNPAVDTVPVKVKIQTDTPTDESHKSPAAAQSDRLFHGAAPDPTAQSNGAPLSHEEELRRFDDELRQFMELAESHIAAFKTARFRAVQQEVDALIREVAVDVSDTVGLGHTWGSALDNLRDRVITAVKKPLPVMMESLGEAIDNADNAEGTESPTPPDDLLGRIKGHIDDMWQTIEVQREVISKLNGDRHAEETTRAGELMRLHQEVAELRRQVADFHAQPMKDEPSPQQVLSDARAALGAKDYASSVAKVLEHNDGSLVVPLFKELTDAQREALLETTAITGPMWDGVTRALARVADAADVGCAASVLFDVLTTMADGQSSLLSAHTMDALKDFVHRGESSESTYPPDVMRQLSDVAFVYRRIDQRRAAHSHH